MRSRLGGILSVLVLTCALVAAGPRWANADQKRIRLGIQPAPVLSWIVKEKQLLEKRGYKPEWTVFPYAAPELEAMAAGSIDIAVMGTLPIVMVAVKDPGIWYIYDELGNGSGMVVAADSNIKSAADLKGKKIAFPGKTSQQYGLLMSYLGAAGLKDTDVELFRANVPDMTTLLRKKEVDGFLGWAPFTSEAVRTGVARLLWTSDDLAKIKSGHWLNAGWAVRSAFAKENEAAVIAVLESLNEANGLLKTDTAEVLRIFAKATGMSHEAVEYVVKNNYFIYFDPAATPPAVSSLKQMFDLLVKHEVIKNEPTIDAVLANFVHPEFAVKALQRK